jgi:GNAT superfamily N-acetyltransferase
VEGSARRATAADAASLTALDEAARLAVAAQRGGRLLLAHDLVAFDPSSVDDPDRLVVVGTIDDVPVGYAVVRIEALGADGQLAVLDALFVEPEARDVGVGEAMMDLVLHWSAARGVDGVDGLALPGDRATKNFFERFGLTARAIVVHRALTDER